MKRLIVLLCLLFLIVPAFLFSQNLDGWTAAYGDWKMVGDRLVQSSTKAGMASPERYHAVRVRCEVRGRR
jgi:hypothetical protein